MPVDPDELATFVAEKAKQDPRVRQIIHHVRMMEGLKEHAGWRWLLDQVRGDRDAFLTRLSRRLMSGTVVDQREIDYMRGYYSGALETLERPEKAAENLEAAARRAYLATQLELQVAEEEDTPYV